MTKKPIKKSPSKKDFFVPAHSKLFEPLNVSTGNKNRRFRRTLSFININRIDSLQQLRKHTFYLNLDQNLKEFIENPSNSHILNNKVSF